MWIRICRTSLIWLRSNYLWAAMGIALLIYGSQRFELPLPAWINNYVNDFLCLPIVLGACQAAVRFLRNDRRLLLPLPLIFLMAFCYSVYFEFFLPDRNLRYTSDGMDVLLYFFGATLFYLIENRGIPRSESK